MRPARRKESGLLYGQCIVDGVVRRRATTGPAYARLVVGMLRRHYRRAFVGPWPLMRAVTLTPIVLALAWLLVPVTHAAVSIHGAQAGGNDVAITEPKYKDATLASDVLHARAGIARTASVAGPDAGCNDHPAAGDVPPGAGNQLNKTGGDGAAADEKQPPGASADKPDKPAAEKPGDNGNKSKAKAERKKARHALPKGDADMNQLLRLWGVFGAQVRSGCSHLHIGNLRCLDDTGEFATLKRYNRPALLTLQEKNHRQTVLLNALNNDGTATLVGGKGTRDVKRQRLLKLWTGRFKVVWRSDAGVKLIEPGSVGSAVVWLRKRLMQIDGKNSDNQAASLSSVYDEALGQRLKAFQKSHGLKADGIAGPRTQMMLNGAVPSPGVPSLRPVKHSEK